MVCEEGGLRPAFFDLPVQAQKILKFKLLFVGAGVMASAILVVPLVLHLVAAAGDGVPTLDVGRSCQAAAVTQVMGTETKQSCMADEQTARDQLVTTWAQFDIADRKTCLSSVMEFDPTYTELLTCLEMASDARKLPDELY